MLNRPQIVAPRCALVSGTSERRRPLPPFPNDETERERYSASFGNLLGREYQALRDAQRPVRHADLGLGRGVKALAPGLHDLRCGCRGPALVGMQHAVDVGLCATGFFRAHEVGRGALAVSVAFTCLRDATDLLPAEIRRHRRETCVQPSAQLGQKGRALLRQAEPARAKTPQPAL